MDFYTNVSVSGSKILYRGVQNGRRVSHKIDYHPKLYLASSSPAEYSTIHGDYLKEITPGTIRDARDFVKMYEDVEGFTIYGNQRYEYAFIAENFPNDVEWDIDSLIISPLDIEVGSENGFPDPAEANEPITAITLRIGDVYYAFGCDPFLNERKDVKYLLCNNETDLIKRFMDIWQANYPDIITGWNVKFFDIPYLINRMTKLFGEPFAKKISPWGQFYERTVIIMGREQRTYVPAGIAVLDYLELYKKFASGGNSQDSYKLDAICHVELGERKLSYDEYGSLHKLYKENPQLFMEYNIRDTELIDKLEDKLKLIELALTLAYDSKSNFEDVFAQVRMWDNIIYNHLHKNKQIVPPIKRNAKDTQYVGAYVKDPLIGVHDWIASFDLNSLYPALIQQYNISPEKHLTKCRIEERIKELEIALQNTK
jgi:DNA polymerase elongation subunit (family B)